MVKVYLFFLCQLLLQVFSRQANLAHDARIIGGTPVSLVPYQVSIRLKYYDEQQFGAGHICGGSLISQRVVVSAAHCTANTLTMPLVYRNPSEFRLVMGSVNLYEKTNYVYNVISVIHNANFNIDTLVNDVALFFMNGRVPTGLSTVHPIALNTYAESAGTMCNVTGWGVTSTGRLSPVLMGAQVPIVSNAVCAKAYVNFDNITLGMLCAGYMQTGGVDACSGDSGGPLVCSNGTLVGIVSWGVGCALGGFPGVYTNVSSYVSWIKWANSTLNYSYYAAGATNLRWHWLTLLLSVLLCCALQFGQSHRT